MSRLGAKIAMCNKAVLGANFLPDANVTEMLLHAARLRGHLAGPLSLHCQHCTATAPLLLVYISKFSRVYSEID
jgi:hypothetical protein